jgi:hypothetical protein
MYGKLANLHTQKMLTSVYTDRFERFKEAVNNYYSSTVTAVEIGIFLQQGKRYFLHLLTILF